MSHCTNLRSQQALMSAANKDKMMGLSSLVSLLQWASVQAGTSSMADANS